MQIARKYVHGPWTNPRVTAALSAKLAGEGGKEEKGSLCQGEHPPRSGLRMGSVGLSGAPMGSRQPSTSQPFPSPVPQNQWQEASWGRRPEGSAARSQSGCPRGLHRVRHATQTSTGLGSPPLGGAPVSESRGPHPLNGGSDTLCPPQLTGSLRHPKTIRLERGTRWRRSGCRAVTKCLTPHLDLKLQQT